MLELRDYQSDAKAALYDYLRQKDGNPCVVIPTAGGKSICIASVAADAVNVWRGRVLILAHVKELVDQNSKELKGLCPDLPVGVYSAGLDRRDTKEPVIVAGIQSICQRNLSLQLPLTRLHRRSRGFQCLLCLPNVMLQLFKIMPF